MKKNHILHQAIAMLFLASGCTTANPGHRVCTENQPLRCEGTALVTCSGDGTDEVDLACPLGCSDAEPRCIDPIPSNSLARHLESSSSRADLDLGESATINTDSGEITVGEAPVVVDSDLVAQTNAPNIRVLVVRSLMAKDVNVTGANALAIVSGSDIAITGTLAVSAKGSVGGAGAFDQTGCTGKVPPEGKVGGAGGGGFGSVGGPGGKGLGDMGEAGLGGAKAGTAELTPLRGGCGGGGVAPDKTPGAGGGAIQLVSRNQILISGNLAANGGGGFGGGGSGGGILLEAPTVEVSGSVVANGGGGGTQSGDNCTSGQDGQLNATPATGGRCKSALPILRASGGAGAAGDAEAKPGSGIFSSQGNGGGGAGRIRINTMPGGLRSTGILSPNPSLGTLATP